MRNNAYLEVSIFIARFDEYGELLVKHLLEKKVIHWDTSIRELAAMVCLIILRNFKLLNNLKH